jgi:RHS repeat-associated protein
MAKSSRPRSAPEQRLPTALQAVNLHAAGIDIGAVRQIATAYDTQGNAYLVTSYHSDGTVANQVQRSFDGLGQLTAEYQAHSGTVNTDPLNPTPNVQYAYSFDPNGTANHSRLTRITYPTVVANGANSKGVVNYNYDGTLNNSISRLTSLSDNGGNTLEQYSYLGLGTVVQRAHPQPGVNLTYIGAPDPAGDPYVGLDRFGRVVDQNWVKTGGASTDHFAYGYDRDSNRTYRQNLTNGGGAFSEAYTYDTLNQLASYQRGTDNGQHTIPNPTLSQSWATDGLGNLTSLPSATGPQTLAYNAQNQISTTGFSSDADGNLTGDAVGAAYKYDAWNRLVQVTSGSTAPTTYQYDGLGRRVVEQHGTAVTDLYFSSSWQVLEERASTASVPVTGAVSGSVSAPVVQAQYVWSPVYVDALVLRDRDPSATPTGSLSERLYAQQDVNWDVTALVDVTGAVVERYADDPYGQVTYLTATWSSQAGSSVAWVYQHQGERLDSVVGLYDSRARVMSPTLDRSLQSDPMRFGSGDTNFYRLVGDNPTNATDPSGLAPWYTERYGIEVPKDGRLHGVDFRGLFEDLKKPSNFTCDQLRELAKLLVKSNKVRGRDANPNEGHAIETIKEYLLYLAVAAAFAQHPDKCGGSLPKVEYDPPQAPRNWQVPQYIKDSLNKLGVKVQKQTNKNRNPLLPDDDGLIKETPSWIKETPSWRMPHVPPNLRDPYPCIRCHPWDGRKEGPIPPPKVWTKQDAIDAGIVAAVVVVAVVVVVTLPVSGPAAAGGGAVLVEVGGTSAAAGLLLSLGLDGSDERK